MLARPTPRLLSSTRRRDTEIASRSTQNRVAKDGLYPHYDVEALWAFFVDTLAIFAQSPGFDAISVTAHGAAAALLGDNDLAMPVIDYEHVYPDDVRTAYAALRPDFAETRSPLLSGGLNVGAQIHYQKTQFPAEFSAAKTIVTYAQYWVWRLTGIAVNEVTSLGCHTDLWNPQAGRIFQSCRHAGASFLDGADPLCVRPDWRSARAARQADRDRQTHPGSLRHPRFQCLAAAASDHPHVALLGRIDRNLGGVFCGRRKVGSARPGTGYARQCRCLWEGGAVGAVHGRTRIRSFDRRQYLSNPMRIRWTR